MTTLTDTELFPITALSVASPLLCSASLASHTIQFMSAHLAATARATTPAGVLVSHKSGAERIQLRELRLQPANGGVLPLQQRQEPRLHSLELCGTPLLRRRQLRRRSSSCDLELLPQAICLPLRLGRQRSLLCYRGLCAPHLRLQCCCPLLPLARTVALSQRHVSTLPRFLLQLAAPPPKLPQGSQQLGRLLRGLLPRRLQLPRVLRLQAALLLAGLCRQPAELCVLQGGTGWEGSSYAAPWRLLPSRAAVLLPVVAMQPGPSLLAPSSSVLQIHRTSPARNQAPQLTSTERASAASA